MRCIQIREAEVYINRAPFNSSSKPRRVVKDSYKYTTTLSAPNSSSV